MPSADMIILDQTLCVPTIYAELASDLSGIRAIKMSKKEKNSLAR